jgi:dipeptidyl aminopeptidase/acylaminoacyl peptidase
VVIDGVDLAKQMGAARVYELHVLDGRPIYFYERDGITRMNFDGRDLPYRYDQVVSGNSGELSVFNPGASGRMVWFYALRDGTWYYVEAGVYE